MKVTVLTLGMIKVNCYLVECENAAFVIDPGKYDERQARFLNENADKERLILITHAHFDHICGAKRLRDETGVKIAIGRIESRSINDPLLNLSNRFHAHTEDFEADILLEDGQEIVCGDTRVNVINVPGHTNGSMCYLIENYLFSGDTLFYNTIGNTDFPEGDFSLLVNSIKKSIFSLPDDTFVLSGHGEKTTVGFEKAYNPFFS